MTQETYSVIGRIAVLRLNNPPVNSLSATLRCALLADLDQANASSEIDAIVLYGSDAVFSCGADIKEFLTDDAGREPNLPTLIRALEDSPKPVVAAVGSQCMGGGLELALACSARVFKSDAQISLPEIRLGLIPGAGGTQLMPRAIGLTDAASMILNGSSRSVKSLVGTPLVSACVDEGLLDEAIAYALRLVASGATPRLRDLEVSDANADLYLRWVRNMVRGGKTGPAPLAALDAVEASLSRYEAGIEVERKLFWELMASTESRGLRHAFMAERECGKIPGLDGAAANQLQIGNVGIVGAGTMGCGIAICFLNAGLRVVLLEASQEALQRGMDNIRNSYQSLADKGRLEENDMVERLSRLMASVEYSTLADVDLAVEAVFEDMAVKESVFRKLSAVVRESAVLASNTSTLDLNHIASFCTHPERVVGLHFFSPANVMKLLEVVKADKTSDAVLAASMKLARRIGKIAVLSGVCDGFIGNRMVNEYLRVAALIVENGASPWQVDAALERWGMAMGPFRMMDLAGNDVGWAIRKRLYVTRPELRFSEIPDLICKRGRMGQKSGKGWYVYPPGQRGGQADPEVDALIHAARVERNIIPREFSDGEIVERCILALVNEGSRILEEGIALRAGDIDVVYLNGYGFPRHRGGPMHYANESGLFGVERKMRALAAEPGGDTRFWQPSALISSLARQGRTLGVASETRE